jgi:hypothetical protein
VCAMSGLMKWSRKATCWFVSRVPPQTPTCGPSIQRCDVGTSPPCATATGRVRALHVWHLCETVVAGTVCSVPQPAHTISSSWANLAVASAKPMSGDTRRSIALMPMGTVR